VFRAFWGSTNNENACRRFAETSQIKMPNCVDLTKDTKWQWFVSFDAGFGFMIFEIMEINENFLNYGSQ